MLGNSTYCPKCRIEVLAQLEDDGQVHCPRCKVVLKQRVSEAETNKDSRLAASFKKRFRERPVAYGTEPKEQAGKIDVRQRNESRAGDTSESFTKKPLTRAQRRQAKIDRFRLHIFPALPSKQFDFRNPWSFDISTAISAGTAALIFAAFMLLVATIFLSTLFHVVWSFSGLLKLEGLELVTGIAIYLLLTLIGFLISGFLIKPFFIKPLRPKSRELSKKTEPMVFKFIESIAHYSGATVPARIEINQYSKIRYHDQSTDVLLISLPEVSQLSTRELIVPLAKVFGRRAQIERYTSLSLVFRLLEFWRIRASGYDLFDVRVRNQFVKKDRNANTKPVWSFLSTPILFVLWFCIESSRKVFQLFYFLTKVFCSGMMRRVDTRALELVAHLVGVDGVESYQLAMARLRRTYASTMRDFLISQDSRFPIKDFSEFLEINGKHILGDSEELLQDDIKTQISKRFDLEETGKFQIQYARQCGQQGLYADVTPSKELFFEFDTASVASTKDLLVDLRFWSWADIVEFSTVKTGI